MGEPAVFDRWEGGLGWMADPDEAMQRTSHALVTDGAVYLIDPVDFDGLDDVVSDMGEVGGVVTLLDRHKRDAVAIATRYDVPVILPGPLRAIADDLAARTRPVTGTLDDTGYEIRPGLANRFWREAALYDGETLVVPEAVGTSAFFTVGRERLGVHPLLRLTPPRRQLGGLSPERVLVGHGEGVMSDGARALNMALDSSRRNSPRLFLKNLRLLLSG